MKNKTKWYLMAAGIFLAFLWNLLCLPGVIPLGKWPFSNTLVIVGCIAVQLPVWFPKRFPKDEPPPKDRKDAPKEEKAAAAVVGGLGFAWLITVIACIVYPL